VTRRHFRLADDNIGEFSIEIDPREADAESIALGREKNARQLDLLEQCQETGIWPAYSQEIETITLPRWAK
jgi:hypothetical protein